MQVEKIRLFFCARILFCAPAVRAGASFYFLLDKSDSLGGGVSAPHDDCLLMHVKRQEKRVKGDTPLKTPLRPEIKSALVKAKCGKPPRQWF